MKMNVKTLIALSMVSTMAGASLFAAPSFKNRIPEDSKKFQHDERAEKPELPEDIEFPGDFKRPEHPDRPDFFDNFDGKEGNERFDRRRMPVEFKVITGKISVANKKGVRTVSITTKDGKSYVLTNTKAGPETVSMNDLAMLKNQKNTTLTGELNEDSGVFTVFKIGRFDEKPVSQGCQK